jgi:hypothetical protein
LETKITIAFTKTEEFLNRDDEEQIKNKNNTV